ncbi:hypothetical protein BV25DRAFT_1818832 [Artomyces pyxidatus]|uniref:Uncharacterized protein n=1 Tax=Artomyces pyxidatus TaxID=48021 RepID=A0ACB8TJ68_9AGAM|nr:hypothetical protein BV25DRAFT_1818832 [Artomyces pyxidatus]
MTTSTSSWHKIPLSLPFGLTTFIPSCIIASDMSIYESPDAHIALRAMYMSRRPQAGNTSSPSPPFNPSKSHVGKDTQRHPFGEISHTKNLGVGAFMKDVDFRKRPDGTIVALPSQDAGLERVGRTIYGQSTPICHGRPAGRQRWPAEEEPRRAWRSENYDCPTLQQVERRNAQQDAAEKARMTMWAANQEDAKRRKQAIESARAYADAMPWAVPKRLACVVTVTVHGLWPGGGFLTGGVEGSSGRGDQERRPDLRPIYQCGCLRGMPGRRFYGRDIEYISRQAYNGKRWDM